MKKRIALVLCICIAKENTDLLDRPTSGSMDGGAIVEEGAPDEIFDHPRSERLQTFLAKVL